MTQSDLPWDDVPADSDVVPGTEEPDPAEVVGDEGEEVDISHPPMPDPSLKYQQETLDQRLSEEVPDRALQEQDAEAAPGVQAAESDEEDDVLQLGEPDDSETWTGDEPAEEAAVHIRDEGEV